MGQKTAYVLDFDGTVTAIDISTELASRFGDRKYKQVEQAYRRKRIGMKKWLAKVSSFLPADLDYLIRLSLKLAVLRPGFMEFLNFVRSCSHEVYIASDGLGFYIEPVLEKFGCLEFIDGIFKNEMLAGRENLEIVITNAHHRCQFCGNCKASQVVKLKQEGYRVIYVGDGMNDRFGASWADQVFARDRLAGFFQKSNISFNPWVDFFDIVSSAGSEAVLDISSPFCNPEGAGLLEVSEDYL
ncbi:MAG TPA: MtnX-like HAD-IB family phosphatase [Firmicutes bacterium]|nr:MtnX-like HAD-IB family phosphatase [Bacillota bacterium]